MQELGCPAAMASKISAPGWVGTAVRCPRQATWVWCKRRATRGRPRAAGDLRRGARRRRRASALAREALQSFADGASPQGPGVTGRANTGFAQAPRARRQPTAGWSPGRGARRRHPDVWRWDTLRRRRAAALSSQEGSGSSAATEREPQWMSGPLGGSAKDPCS
jgi:hypothetical protein